MRNDPMEEWRRLTEHYRSLSDEGLLELAADQADLTETAQHVLRDEMKTRGVSVPASVPKAQQPGTAETVVHRREDFDVYISSANGRDEDQSADGPIDLTWKTELCECETQEQARQLAEVLRRAGIDRWIESRGVLYPRIMVAADQLDQALAIAARPIPQEIIDQAKAETEAPSAQFELPRCPSCGANDPTLEGVEPTNQWRCEVCGRQWSEPEVFSPADRKA
jgi:hypothetical protein